jgi:hypothetical protein
MQITLGYVKCSIADLGCLSWILDPDFYSSRFPDPTTAPKEEGENIFCPSSFVSNKYHKIVNNFIFQQVKKFF